MGIKYSSWRKKLTVNTLQVHICGHPGLLLSDPLSSRVKIHLRRDEKARACHKKRISDCNTTIKPLGFTKHNSFLPASSSLMWHWWDPSPLRPDCHQTSPQQKLVETRQELKRYYCSQYHEADACHFHYSTNAACWFVQNQKVLQPTVVTDINEQKSFAEVHVALLANTDPYQELTGIGRKNLTSQGLSIRFLETSKKPDTTWANEMNTENINKTQKFSRRY